MDSEKRPAGVLFDFDGVVVDSLSAHLVAWRTSYADLYGTALLDTEGLPGRSTMAIADILAQRAGRPETKQQLAELKREALRHSALAIQFLPGAEKSFIHLTAANVPFGIASNAPQAFITSTLARLGVQVVHRFGCDDVTNPKPDPEVFLRCAKALGISVLAHHRVIVFEDSPHGLTAAVRAGMFPIGILTQNTAEQMRAAGAKAVCAHLDEAIDFGWLEQLPELLISS
jgi:beta-phosphoglucomutase